MARPVVTDFAEAAYARLAPVAADDERLGWPLLTFMNALATMFEAVESISRSTGLRVPYSQLLDVETCPPLFLPFLAQLAGVTLRPPKVITEFNLVGNPSVEVLPLTAFFAYHLTTTRVNGGTWGTHMLHASVTTNGDPAVIFSTAMGPYVALTGSVDVISTSRDLQLRLVFEDESNNILLEVDGDLSSVVGRRAVTATSPPGTAFAYFQIVQPSSVVGQTFDLDAFRMSFGTQSDYFDGSFPGAEWINPTALETSPSQRTRSEALDEWAAYARDAIRRRSGRRRGTPDAMVSAIEETLTDTQTVRLLERVGGDAYAMTAITRPLETPDPDVTLAAAISQKPAGILLTVTQSDLPLIDEGTRTIDAATATIDDATLADVT